MSIFQGTHCMSKKACPTNSCSDSLFKTQIQFLSWWLTKQYIKTLPFFKNNGYQFQSNFVCTIRVLLGNTNKNETYLFWDIESCKFPRLLGVHKVLSILSEILYTKMDKTWWTCCITSFSPCRPLKMSQLRFLTFSLPLISSWSLFRIWAWNFLKVQQAFCIQVFVWRYCVSKK